MIDGLRFSNIGWVAYICAGEYWGGACLDVVCGYLTCRDSDSLKIKFITMATIYKTIFGAVLLLSLISVTANGQATNWVWSNSAGGNNFSDYGRNIDIDDLGNSFVVGYFQSPVITFGDFTLYNSDITGYSHDVFIVKYSPTGKVLWAKSVGGNSWDGGNGICVDASGNAIIAGRFQSDFIVFDSDTLFNGGASDIFITKYDQSGNVVWAKRAGGSSFEMGYAVSTDASENILLAGVFFSPTIVFGNDTLVNSGNNIDVFVAKFDSSGNPLWARSAKDAASYSICADPQGNVIMAGWFNGTTIIFGNDTLTNSSNASEIFLVKYDPSGNVLWAKSAGGTNEEKCSGVSTDASGNIFITGFFKSVAIAFGADTLTNAHYTGYVDDIFIAKYGATGSVIWAKSIGGSGGDEGWSVDTDVNGNSWLTGYTNNTDIIIAAYNTSGNLVWLDSIEASSGGQMGYGLKADGYGNLFLTGQFTSPEIAFGSYVLANSDNTSSSSDVFVAKLNFGFPTNLNDQNSVSVNIFPNPFSNLLTFSLSDNKQAKITLYNLLGQQVFQQIFSNSITINAEQLAEDIYIYELLNDKGTFKIGKIVKH